MGTVFSDLHLRSDRYYVVDLHGRRGALTAGEYDGGAGIGVGQHSRADDASTGSVRGDDVGQISVHGVASRVASVVANVDGDVIGPGHPNRSRA
ncbi:hypothetical protein BJD99_00090 [Rhodococcus sp. 1163]|nr:hypothetical protein BJD99_00090 [Rhodococcus sp. 1163]